MDEDSCIWICGLNSRKQYMYIYLIIKLNIDNYKSTFFKLNFNCKNKSRIPVIPIIIFYSEF